MKVEFPFKGYENIPPVEVPDENLMGVYSPIAMPEIDEANALQHGFLNPVGAPRLRDAVRGNKSVLILVDDATRTTPIARILPHVFAELTAGGIASEQVTFLTAQGTHRRMTDAELKHKLGDAFGKYKVFQHDWKDAASFHYFGKTRDGTPVNGNKLLTQHDFVLGMGAIVPHRVKGFSGGAKIAFPGVSGPEMMDRNQWEASMQMSETVMGVPENPMRLRMEEAAKMAGLHYIVNVVGDVTGKIVGCFCGDVVQAHREGCKLSRQVTAAKMPGRADIVLTDSYPADRDFWQSAKGFYSSTMAVREGGSIVMVSPNPEGVASNHPNLMEIGYKPHAELVAMVQEGKVNDLVGAAILADTVQIIDHADCIIATPGFGEKDAKRIGLRYARNGQEGLKMAFEKQGKKARVAVLRHGGHILPLADEKAVALHL